MKKLYILLVALFVTLTTFAQTDGFSYQAVILNPDSQQLPGVDASGAILPNKDISIRFSILNEYGNVEYQEIQYTTTDAYGMINLFIGEGEETVGNGFNSIRWEGLKKDLKVEIDFYGGTNFKTLGSQKLSFIPYEYHRNINASGDLSVDGLTTFNGDFIVEGITTFNNDLNIEGILNLNNDLNVEGNSNFNGDAYITGTLGVQAATSLEDELSVNGITNLNNDLNVTNGSSTTLSGNLTVENNTSLIENLTVEGVTELNNELSVNGIISLNNNLNVTNGSPTNLSGTLLVEGLTTFNNGLVIEGETVINDNLLVEGEVEVNGITNLNNDLFVNNDSSANLNGALNVSGETNLKNTLNVIEQADSNLSGILNVEGVSNLNNDVNVQGKTNLEDEFNVNNSSVSNLSGELNVAGISNLNNNLNVQGITNLEDEFNVNNASVSNLSGELNVAGISNLNNELNVVGATRLNSTLWVDGNARLENNLYVGAKMQVADSLNVEGSTLLSNLVVRGSNDVGGASGANHIALFENTSTSSESDGIAIRIHGNASGKIGFKNRFITFYGSANGGDYMAGRIESYDLLAGDLWESFPIPDFENLINLVDFNSIELEGGTLPSLSSTSGTLPILYYGVGSLPSIDFDEGTFDDGSLPWFDFRRGTFPTFTLDTGSFPTLNLDGFWNPSVSSQASDEIGAMVGWGLRNGSPGYLPTGPWGIALAPLIIAAKQVARDQGVIYGSKGADYAEWLEKENPTDKFMFGEVVGVKGGKISRNTTDADQVMSISLAPIVLGNMPDADRKEDFEKVGFMGQVPVLTLGDVEVGDYIVASGYNDGYAKALSAEEITLKDLKNIIGRAWTGSEGQKASIINVSVGLKTNEWVTIFEQQEKKINEIETKLSEMELLSERLEKLESKINKLSIN